jgi:hypothetical protein
MDFANLEEFMLTGKKIANSTFFTNKQQINFKNESTKLSTPKPGSMPKCEEPKEEFMFPNQKDALFWCFYIMKNGIESFASLDNINVVLEKKMKIECVEFLRKNKSLLKAAKISPLTTIENFLVNEDKIDVNTFFALCVANNISALYIYKNTYFLLNASASVSEKNPETETYGNLHIVKRIENTLKTGILQSEKKAKEYLDTFYKVDNISKPVKAMSAYKLDEIVEIAKKLGIETINSVTNKQKTKKDIYELIVQYF